MGGKWNRWVTPNSDKIDGKRVVRKEYNQWAGMFNRAKGQKYYEDVKISELFKSYDLWCEWAREQKGFLNTEYNGKIWSIDKDILGDGTIYSEDVCVFVPTEINNLVKGSGKTNLPTGVVKDAGNKSNPFTAKLNNRVTMLQAHNIKQAARMKDRLNMQAKQNVKSAINSSLVEKTKVQLQASIAKVAMLGMITLSAFNFA